MEIQGSILYSIYKLLELQLTKTCFIISSIGEKGSEIRDDANEKFDLVFEPVLKEEGYDDVTRADKIGTPGSISYDIVNHIIKSELVIADVSDLNPNVFYELAIRNAIQKPVIIIKAEDQKMPFDIYDKRAISLDMSIARQWTNAKKELKEQIKNVEKDPESASKSILSDFTGFQIDGVVGTETDLKLELKDLKSEVRRIFEEVRRPRSTMLSSSDIEQRRKDRMENVMSAIQENIDDGKIFSDKKLLAREIARKIRISPIVSERYVTILLKEGRLTENEHGIVPNDN